MKRIVHITSVHPPFDARIFGHECRSLAARGFDVHLVAVHPRDEVVDGVHVWGIPAPRTRLGRIFSTTRAVYRKARALGGDLYHFHDPELLPWGVLLQRRLGVPVIYDSHEFFALDTRFKVWLPYVVRVPLSIVAGWVERVCVRRLAGVVAVNEKMAEEFQGHPNVGVVANYPRLAFADAARDVEPRPHTAIFTGPIDVSRGFVNVFEAMQIVRRKYPGAVCRIVGKLFRHHLPESLAQFADEEFARFGVEILPSVPHDQIAALARSHAVGWIPSHYQRSFLWATPIKLIEFMALGMPVVMSDLPMARSIVESNDCGLLVDPDDPAKHAEALMWLWEHAEEGAAMAARGRRAVIERLHWEHQLESLLRVYDRAWSLMSAKTRSLPASAAVKGES